MLKTEQDYYFLLVEEIKNLRVLRILQKKKNLYLFKVESAYKCCSTGKYNVAVHFDVW